MIAMIELTKLGIEHEISRLRDMNAFLTNELDKNPGVEMLLITASDNIEVAITCLTDVANDLATAAVRIKDLDSAS